MFHHGKCTYSVKCSSWMRMFDMLNHKDSNYNFRLASMKSQENQIYDRGKYMPFFFDGLGPSHVV